MKNSIILSTAEIQQNVIVKRMPIKPQPYNVPEGAYMDPYNHNFEHFTMWTKDNRMCLGCGGNIKGTAHWKPPYQPGQVVYAREGWACDGFNGQEFDYVYSADIDCGRIIWGDEHLGEWAPVSDYFWHSPVTMPKEAARLWMKVVEVKAVFDQIWYWEMTMERTEAK